MTNSTTDLATEVANEGDSAELRQNLSYASPLVGEAAASVALDGETQSHSNGESAAAARYDRDNDAVAEQLGLPVEDSSKLDPHEIVRRIGQAVTVNERGWFVCPVCGGSHPHFAGIGQHFYRHWKEAGLKGKPNETKDIVRCPECNERITRASLAGHMEGQHGTNREVGAGIARIIDFDLDEYLAPAPPPPPPTVRLPVLRANTAPREILRRLGQPIIQLDGGAAACPVCGHTVAAAGALGVHFGVHWDELGIPRPKDTDDVECPLCGFHTKRSLLAAHLQTMKHGSVPADEARGIARTSGIDLRRALREGSNVPAVTEQPSLEQPAEQPEDPGVHAEVTNGERVLFGADDAALAVIASQSNGSVPTHLLPEVLRYVDHTRELFTLMQGAIRHESASASEGADEAAR